MESPRDLVILPSNHSSSWLFLLGIWAFFLYVSAPQVFVISRVDQEAVYSGVTWF